MYEILVDVGLQGALIALCLLLIAIWLGAEFVAWIRARDPISVERRHRAAKRRWAQLMQRSMEKDTKEGMR